MTQPGFDATAEKIMATGSVFTKAAETIEGLRDKVALSEVSGRRSGRVFTEVGERYREAVDRLEDNLNDYANKAIGIGKRLELSATRYAGTEAANAAALRAERFDQ